MTEVPVPEKGLVFIMPTEKEHLLGKLENLVTSHIGEAVCDTCGGWKGKPDDLPDGWQQGKADEGDRCPPYFFKDGDQISLKLPPDCSIQTKKVYVVTGSTDTACRCAAKKNLAAEILGRVALG